MQMMVEEQGQTFDQIEHNAQETSKDLEQGNKHVDRAIVLAKSTRAVSVSAILCVVLLYIDYFCVRKNGVVSLLPLFLPLSLLFLFGGLDLTIL